MIISFRSKATEDIYEEINSKAARKIPYELWRAAKRKLDWLSAAVLLQDLKAPPGNRLEVLKGNLSGKYSIRINEQYRIIFAFKNGNANDVEIVDYH